MTAIMLLENVSKCFGEGPEAVHALSEMSLSVNAGEFTLLMGPSGSGKTTMLSIMGCILSPTSGRVVVASREATKLTEAERASLRLEHIGFVFQSYNLFPTLTVRENIQMTLFLKGFTGTKAQRLADQAVEAVGLSDKTNVFPRNLSGGQKQRVAIARALAGDHSIILADEPTAALDFHSGKTVLQLLRNLADQGYAIVVVTHDPRIISFADRTVSLEDGRVVSDSYGEIIDRERIAVGA